MKPQAHCATRRELLASHPIVGLLRTLAVFAFLGALFGGVPERAPQRLDLDALLASAGMSQDVVTPEDFDDDVLADEVVDVQPDDELSLTSSQACGRVEVTAAPLPVEHPPCGTHRPEGPFRPPRIALL